MTDSPSNEPKTALVSVVIPLYNGETYITETITSILKSDYPSFEIILIDDGSTDKSKKIAESLSQIHKNVHVFSFPKNRGMSHALNFGIERAKGDYIARINQDDLMLPDRLRKQVEFLKAHLDHYAVGGSIELFNDNGKTIDKIIFPQTNEEIKSHWLYLSPFADPACTYRKSAFEKTEGYNQRFWPVDDVQMWYQLGAIGKLANLKDMVTRVRWHENAGSIKSHRLQVKRLFQLHLWANKNVTRANLFVWMFWIMQLCAGYIFPATFNWWVFRLLRRVRY